MSHYVSHFNVRQTEGGPRYVQEGHFQNYTLTVATGYDAQRDTYPVHVYVQAQGGNNGVAMQRPAFAAKPQRISAASPMLLPV